MSYDIAIIGGGPGGYVAAIYAGKKKAKVALIEKQEGPYSQRQHNKRNKTGQKVRYNGR